MVEQTIGVLGISTMNERISGLSDGLYDLNETLKQYLPEILKALQDLKKE